MGARMRHITLLLFALCAIPAPGFGSELETDCYEAVPAINTAIYADQENVGGKLTFADPNPSPNKRRAGFIKQLVIVDQDGENAAFTFYLFCRDPSNGTYTNNAALDIHDTDNLNICCMGHVTAADYEPASDNSIAQVDLACFARAESGQDLYGLLKTDAGSTPTYTANTDLLVKVCLSEDPGN